MSGVYLIQEIFFWQLQTCNPLGALSVATFRLKLFPFPRHVLLSPCEETYGTINNSGAFAIRIIICQGLYKVSYRK